MEEKLKKIKNGDLHALLSICDQKELDPIVKILVDQITCSLEDEYDYKKYFPDHTQYPDLIASEICAFGGNTIANIKRQGKGVPYHEIVFDVCKRLGIPRVKTDTVNNEEALLRLYELEAEKVDKNKSNIKGEVLKAILPRMVMGPWGLLSLPLQAAAPAYRVTVPCVQYIAELRKKKIVAHEKQSTTTASTSAANASERTSNIVTVENEYKERIFSLMQVPDSPQSGKWDNLNESNMHISRLNPLLQAVPSLVTANNVNTTKYMEVFINGPLTKAKSFAEDGAFRAITKGENGQITENAKLFAPANLSKLVNAAALFQIASVVVAQKHLADISQKLTEIKAVVESIAEFQKNQRKSQVLGAIAYYEQVAPSLIGGELSQAVQHQIEAKESELLAIQNHLITDIINFNANLEINDNDKVGTGKTVEAIKLKQETIKRFYNELLLCIRARACGWQLLSFYPDNISLVKNRKESLQSELQKLNKDGSLLLETEKTIVEKIKGISSKFNSDTTLNERKLLLLDLNQSIFSEITAEKEKIEQEVEHAESFVTTLKQPVAKVLVKVENNQIVATNFA